MMHLLLLLWLYLGVSEAQEASPEVRIPVGEYVQAHTFPKIHDTMVEIRLSHCEQNLSEMLDSIRREHIRSITAINIGEESWLLRVVLTKEGLQVDANTVDGFLEIWIREEDSLKTGFRKRDTITTPQLLKEKFDTGVVSEPNIKLRSLYGQALAFQMSPEDAQTDIGMPIGINGSVEWSDIDEARRNYLQAKEMGQELLRQYGDSAYTLGWGYLSKGFSQEALYYFDQLQYTPGSVKPMVVYLSKARAQILLGEWDKARQNLERAYFYGADEATVVEGMGYVSHETGIPNRASTGRLLASLTSRPESLLLAGELLQMDGLYEESREILEPLFLNKMFEEEGQEELKQRLALRLGDAALNANDIPRAREYWIQGPKEITDLRVIQARMLEKGSNEWVRSVPQLKMIANKNDGDVEAEALYLIGQVYSEYGTQLDGIELWSDFIQFYPELAMKTDVIDLLWSLYRDRIRTLYRKNESFRIAQTHQIGWTPILKTRMDDPELVTMVAKSYESLGLSEKALQVLAVDFGIGVNKSFYAPESELYLAQLYFKSNRYYEALRTLEILESNPYPKEMEPDIRYLESQIFLATQRRDEAKARLEYTALFPKYRTQSYIALGILAKEAGDCTATVSYLRPILLPYNAEFSSDPLAYLYLSQCLAELGQSELAVEVANILEEIAPSDDEMYHARYLQANYGEASQVQVEDTGSTWNELVEEFQEEEQFQKDYDEWLKLKK